MTSEAAAQAKGIDRLLLASGGRAPAPYGTAAVNYVIRQNRGLQDKDPARLDSQVEAAALATAASAFGAPSGVYRTHCQYSS
jgi:hypothetical protein